MDKIINKFLVNFAEQLGYFDKNYINEKAEELTAHLQAQLEWVSMSKVPETAFSPLSGFDESPYCAVMNLDNSGFIGKYMKSYAMEYWFDVRGNKIPIRNVRMYYVLPLPTAPNKDVTDEQRIA